jgi:DNA-binding CsgD family transcriptional regulator
MVGRDRELARVTTLLDGALAGHGRLVMCTGEAGIGKTRLAEEVAALAAARGAPVTWARAADRGSLPPYGLWRLVLDDPAVRGGAIDRARPDLWSRVFGDAKRQALADDPDSSSAQRFALFADVRDRLIEAGERSGLLLVLDDLQWADEASAVLLADVARQLRGTRILIFATYRDSAVPGDPGGGLLLRMSADSDTERVDLHGLPVAAVEDLLLATGLPASPERASEVHSETGGNPFLVRELARGLLDERGAGLGEQGPVPGRVLEATGYRLAQVTDAARELLHAAAVAGNNFSAGVVARMLDVRVLSLLGPLDECRAAGFLVTGDRPGDHRFSHALVRSAVAARLSAAEQRRLHAAAADAIAALYEGDLRPHLAEIARHRVEGSWPGDRARAVAACEAAAEVAAEALAFEEVVRLYRQALSAGEGEIGEDDRSRLELGLAAALHRSGDLSGWQETASRVARRAELRRDRLLLARTALVMDASGEPGWDAEICRTCEQALVAEGLPDDLRARVSSRYAQALVYGGRYERAGEVSRDALAVAEASGDPLALVDALRARQLACCASEGVAERAVLAQRMLGAADSTGSAWEEMWGRLWRIDTLFEAGQLRSIQHIGCEASGLPEHWRSLPDYFQPEAVDPTRGLATVFPALAVAQIQLDQRDRDGAVAAYGITGPVRSWTPSPAMRMSSLAFGLQIAIGLDRQEDIEFVAAWFEPFRGRHVANGAGTGIYMGPVELQLGEAAAALGRLDAAVRDLQTAISSCDANGACGYGVQASAELAAALARRQAPGDQDQARAVLDRAAPEADRLGMAPFIKRIEQLRAQLPGAVISRSPLSPRELEVARLVARGLTNKQIGQALYVSERTAENHVQHILVKLGFSNRSQIAAWSSAAGPS